MGRELVCPKHLTNSFGRPPSVFEQEFILDAVPWASADIYCGKTAFGLRNQFQEQILGS